MNKLAIILLVIGFSCSIDAKKGYSTKAPYAGYGKISKTTGKIKTKATHGYFKPSNGYKFVNSYAKS